MQRRECEDFIARHSDWVYYGERLEKGVSGYKVSTSKRDVILEIRAMAERKEFDVLLVFMFDRLGRREDETPFLVQWFIESANKKSSPKLRKLADERRTMKGTTNRPPGKVTRRRET